MPVDGWRVFYTGGRQYTSERTDWRELPADGVLIVVVYFDEFTTQGVRYRHTLSGDDYYFRVPGTDVFGSNSDAVNEIMHRYSGVTLEDIKRGKWTTREDMQRTRDKAADAPCP